MRAKILLLAAIGVASAATAMAQVYSANAVGYVNRTLGRSFNMLANPLDNTQGNKVSQLLGALPDGSIVYKWNGTGYDNNSWTFGAWDDANMVLAPGTGFFVWIPSDAPAANTITFVGEVPQGHLVNPLPVGFSLKSSMVPQAGNLSTELGFPPSEGDLIYKWNPTAGIYDTFAYSFGAWDPAPLVDVADGFFVLTDTARDWARDFSVSP